MTATWVESRLLLALWGFEVVLQMVCMLGDSFVRAATEKGALAAVVGVEVAIGRYCVCARGVDH